MADGTSPGRQMSLIPYARDSREIVLRRGNAVVLYDTHSRQLSVRDNSEQPLEITDCPFCHRPLRDGEVPEDSSKRSRPYSSDGPFVDPEYFAMLADSQRPSPSGSGQSTPARPVFHSALRSGRSREVSATADPPTGAEFVASEPAPSSRQGISSSAFSPGFFKQFFKEEGELGRGGNGVVLLVEHIMDGVSLGHFACKRIPVGDSHTWLEKVLIEVKLLQRMPHRNIVPCHWTWLEDFQSSKFGPSIPCLWILQDYCNGGDLHNYVLGPREVLTTAQRMKERLRRKSRSEVSPPRDLRGGSKLSLEEIFSFFRDITSGLHHLHSKGYIHRDLKPSNCLLQRDGGKIRVLISDFGEVQEAGSVRGSTGATGTISYCAPEVLQRGTDGSFGNFTTKSDVFSLGMIVYFMCFGRLPYVNADGVDEEHEDLESLRIEITTWTGFDEETRSRTDLPEKLYRFLRRLLSVDPTQRPSTDEILSSIIGGVPPGGGDYPDAAFDDHFSSSSRIIPPSTDVSTPSTPSSTAPTTTRRRKPSALIPRSGMTSPALRRDSSTEMVRSRSPTKPDASNLPPRSGPASPGPSSSEPASSENSSVALRPRKIDLPPPPRPSSASSTSTMKQIGSPHLSPRLLLPPPSPPPPLSQLPRRALDGVVAFVRRPEALRALRVGACLVKILSVTVPCSPYSAAPGVFYPLLVFAVLELSVLRLGPARALVAWLVHLLVVLLAYSRGRLCEGGRSFVAAQ